MYATDGDDALETLRMVRRPDLTQPMPAVMVGADPPWLAGLLTMAFVLRARAMAAALGLLLLRPRRFGQAWTAGAGDIPNPAVTLATAISVQALLAEVTNALLHRDVAHTILTSTRESLSDYAKGVVMGICAHVVLRLLGSRRRFLTTVGVTFFVLSATGLVQALVKSVCAVGVGLRYGVGADLAKVGPVWLNAVVLVLLLGMMVYGVLLTPLALAGAHGVARWKGFVAGTLALVALFGVLPHFPDWLKTKEELPELHVQVGRSYYRSN
jgi:hypothetical protein